MSKEKNFSSSHELFGEFLSSCCEGHVPDCAAPELRKYLSLQQERLRSLGLSLNREIKNPGGSVISRQRSTEIPEPQGLRQLQHTKIYSYLSLKKEFYRDWELLYRRSAHVQFYETMEAQLLSGPEGESSQQQVSDFYALSCPMLSDHALGIIKKLIFFLSLAVGLLISGILFIHFDFTDFFYSLIMGGIFFVLSLCLSWLFIFLPYLAWILLIIIIKIPPALKQSISGRRADLLCYKYPELRYELFEEKALLISKLILLCYGKEPCPLELSLPEEFKNILDIEYQGYIKVLFLSESDGILNVEIELPLKLILLSGRKIRVKRRKFKLKLSCPLSDARYSPGLRGWSVGEFKML